MKKVHIIGEKKIHVIGLHGRIGSGKDEVAKYLHNVFAFRQLAFADRVKEVCKYAFGFSDEQMTKRELKEKVNESLGISPRDAFRIIGHGFRESVRDDIWIMPVRDRIKSDMWHKNFVISDVRYQNEIDFITHEMNGHVIHINRPGNPYDEYSTHASDLQQLNIPYIIENNAGINELHICVLLQLYNIGYLDKTIFKKL